MAVNQLKNKFLGDDSVESRNLLIEQGGAVRAKDSTGTEQELLKFGAANEVLANGAEIAYKSVTDAIQGDLDIAEGEIDTLQSDVLGIDGRLTTAEGEIDTLQSDLLALDGRVSTAESDIVNLQSDKVNKAGDTLTGTFIHENGIDATQTQHEAGTSTFTFDNGVDPSSVAIVNGGGMNVQATLLGAAYELSIGADSILLTQDGSAKIATQDEELVTKLYVDQETSALDGRLTTAEGDIVALEAEDLTFLKLDGSRPMEANLNMMDGLTHYKIVGLADPTDARDAVNKQYVDAIAEGLHVHAPVKTILVDSLASLTGGSVTYDNGVSGVGATLTLGVALTVHDDYNLQNGDRIIVAGEATQAHNGVYTWATGGLVLTRALDFDTPAEVAGGDFIFVQEGTQFGNTGWVETETTVSIGSSAIVFLQFSGAGSYTAGDALDLIGGEFNVKFDDASIGVNGSNQLYVKALGIATGMIQDDAVDKSKIAADVAGDGLGQDVDGSLKVNVDNVSLEIDADNVRIKDDGVTASKINSDVAGNGLGQAIDGSLEVNVDSVSIEIFSDSLRIADDGVTAAKLNADVVSNGLQQEVSGALSIKLDGSSLAVSASGLKSNIGSAKEVYQVSSTLTSGAFYDLQAVAEVDSIVAFVDRVAIHEGALWDFTVSYTGGVGGVTRITFVNALVTPGQSQLSSGDNVFFKYEKKLA